VYVNLESSGGKGRRFDDISILTYPFQLSFDSSREWKVLIVKIDMHIPHSGVVTSVQFREN
jgi:hypothetical protein